MTECLTSSASMVNTVTNNETHMTPNPIPFITSIKREADGFANGLHLAALAPGAVFLIWSFMGVVGLPVSAPPAAFKAYVHFTIIAWLAFFGVCAVVDYTIYAVFRAFSEWLDAAISAYRQSVEDQLAVEQDAFSKEPAGGQPDQRDNAVAYLHDFIKRSRQATDDASPLNPTPPAA